MSTSSALTVGFKQAAVSHCLSRCTIFAGLPAPELESIANIVVVRTLAKGDYLFREGDECRGFFVVQQGSISLLRLLPDGKEQVIHVFRENQSFGEGALAMERGYPVDARADEPSQVLQVEKASFLGMVRQKPELALRMMASLAQHNRLLLSQLEDLTSKDVECRLAAWLLKRCQGCQNGEAVVVELTVTKRVLAAELGTAAETLSRAFAALRQLQLLTPQGRTLVLPDPAKLSAFVRSRTSCRG